MKKQNEINFISKVIINTMESKGFKVSVRETWNCCKYNYFVCFDRDLFLFPSLNEIENALKSVFGACVYFWDNSWLVSLKEDGKNVSHLYCK